MPPPDPLKVVALGGGHGLAATLRGIRRITPDVTAIVGVADDGGSSGRIRSELDVLPPGDLRMALSALCGEDAWGETWARVVQHRFGGEGHLAGHALGNLLIAALWEETGDLVAGLDWVGALLRTEGRVLPVALEPIELVAVVRGADPERPEAAVEVRGQVSIARTQGSVLRLFHEPESPRACPEAIESILAADCVVLGPGSWFTSLMPHLLIPEVRSALEQTKAARILVLNLRAQTGETTGFTPETHLRALWEHAPGLRIDCVIADVDHVPDPDALRAAAREATVHLARVAAPGDTGRHDPAHLGTALQEALASMTSPHGRIAAWR